MRKTTLNQDEDKKICVITMVLKVILFPGGVWQSMETIFDGRKRHDWYLVNTGMEAAPDPAELGAIPQ